MGARDCRPRHPPDGTVRADRRSRDRSWPGTRDLQWWRVQAWVRAAPRVMATWLLSGLVAGLALGLLFGVFSAERPDKAIG
jgi:hypothetical protein